MKTGHMAFLMAGAALAMQGAEVKLPGLDGAPILRQRPRRCIVGEALAASRRFCTTPLGAPAGAAQRLRWGKEEGGRIAQFSPRLAETERFELLLTS